MTDDLLGKYEVQPFPPSRTPSIDSATIGQEKHYVPVLFEADVTGARAAIRRRKQETGEAPSFTGWVIKCLATAVSEHPQMHAVRKGRREQVIFEDVDVTTLVERELAGEETSILPVPCVIRRTQTKRLEQIHAEIRAAQSKPLAPGEQVLDPEGGRAPPVWAMRLYFASPWFLRRLLVWNRMMKNPFELKRSTGTVVVTAIGMYGGIGSGGIWAIPSSTVPLVLAIGGIARKPVYVDATLEPRELLSLTLLFDHDVVDGAPVFAFVARLRELLETAFALPA
jgi:pyruvate/2-oxoglutarate dehydrogenase complex dihydrolipoamide acyltransferase (E2) component